MNKDEILKRLGNTAVHCPTLELDKKVSELADSVGLTWDDGDRYNEVTVFDGEDYCHDFRGGRKARIGFYKDRGDNIISASEFISWFEAGIEIPKPIKPAEPIIKRERILANRVEYLETVSKALNCKDGDILLAWVNPEGSYEVGEDPLTPAQMRLVARWAMDLEGESC